MSPRGIRSHTPMPPKIQGVITGHNPPYPGYSGTRVNNTIKISTGVPGSLVGKCISHAIAA